MLTASTLLKQIFGGVGGDRTVLFCDLPCGGRIDIEDPDRIDIFHTRVEPDVVLAHIARAEYPEIHGATMAVIL